MPDEKQKKPPEPPRYRAGESGDFSRYRNHGPARSQDSKLTVWAVGAFGTLLLLAVAGLSGWALTTISGKAEAGSAGVTNLTPRVEHVEEGQKALFRGQERISGEIREVRELLFTLPKDRRRKED